MYYVVLYFVPHSELREISVLSVPTWKMCASVQILHTCTPASLQTASHINRHGVLLRDCNCSCSSGNNSQVYVSSFVSILLQQIIRFPTTPNPAYYKEKIL